MPRNHPPSKSRNHKTRKSACSKAHTRPRAGARIRKELPPEPLMLLTKPTPDELASDGTVCLPAHGERPGTGWMVFDAQGRMRALVMYLREEPTVEDLLLLQSFERERFELGDPRFADYQLALRCDQAMAAPRGPADLYYTEYSYQELVADGSRSVLVSTLGHVQAVLVLDTDGRLLDGAHFPVMGGQLLSPLFERRFAEFLRRRVKAGDPFLKVVCPDGRSTVAFGDED